ncbi:asparagine synthase (glutamine-hydrolyzing) [Vibrio fluvialis]|nr:asparagine synthase (glutamine-hydrolyzing) [Vibrio fluvialis]EKO3465774.1 asparagine synthase (glutamine-hydrolyzing) [Vibrio fluvialis]EKO3506060.1 asparagine synthase (glutamine-hydrolyzing) [Vibrio fluvialis]EKO5152197.1 asparagine synthase (glutamine-hydrolyzing) [Vibrio fluvialis]ELO4022113.1 asparagine synthase (glutamine-hydrolyzing) [Vibrio fluvialis]
MCGIYGVVNKKVQHDEMMNVLKKINHRGPDGYGIWKSEDGNIGLGHVRLSIVDLTNASSQPFESLCSNYIIVFNGEIYNYIELKKSLEKEGIKFVSDGDTEVLLNLYIKYGHRCLSMLNGMFSFAIYNRLTNNVFLARDRLGKKPLYYSNRFGNLEFCSELKAFSDNVVSTHALNLYLHNGYISEPYSLIDNVFKLPAGHYANYDVNNKEFNIVKYWDVPDFVKDTAYENIDDAVQEQWDLIKDSVSKRLHSDVSTGILLSGGIDSSIIALAASSVESNVSTFTMSLKGHSLDESVKAKKIANILGTNHHELELNSNNLDISFLNDLVDEPLADSSIIPTYLISNLISKNIKVVLGGDGGDEVYGGYEHYSDILKIKQSKALVSVINSCGSILKWARFLPVGFRGRSKFLSFSEGVECSSVVRTSFFDDYSRSMLLKNEFYEKFSSVNIIIDKLKNSDDIVCELLKYDLSTELRDGFLFKVDRASMMNSIEVRSPFLDYRIVESAFSRIPSKYKADQYSHRYIQKNILKLFFPEYEFSRKQGFSIDINAIAKTSGFKEVVYSLPTSLINFGVIDSLYDGLYKGRSNGARLFSLYMLSVSLKNLSIKVV